MHSLNMGVSEASLMPSMNLSIFGVFMPARSYPTLALNMKPSSAPRP